MHQSLRKGGELVIDCQGVHMDGDFALFPKGRYAGAKGVFFVPTLGCLFNWLKRAQFHDVNCFFKAPLSVSEQRSTPWAPISSLQSFLDPEDNNKTVEGYPAPWRFYLKARKR